MLVQALTLPLVAPSLGGVESLITMPAATTHLALGKDAREVISPACYARAPAIAISGMVATSNKFCGSGYGGGPASTRWLVALLQAAGISESLIRLSVGIEGLEDLKADFAQALKEVAGSPVRTEADCNGHGQHNAQLA